MKEVFKKGSYSKSRDQTTKMWNQSSIENRQMEKRVIVGRVRPTWARNLPDAREDEDKNDQEGVMPHSEPPSPTEHWEQNVKQEDKYDVFGKVSNLFSVIFLVFIQFTNYMHLNTYSYSKM